MQSTLASGAASPAARPSPSRRLAAAAAVVLVLGMVGLSGVAPSGAATAGLEGIDPPVGYHFRYVHFFFDSKDATWLEAAGCDGVYGKGTHGCSGGWASATTTPPFAGTHGTITWRQQTGTDAFDLNLFAVGAELRGTVSSPTSTRYDVASLIFPDARAGFTDAQPGIEAGQMGGPLYIGHTDRDCASTPELAICDATLDIRGYLLVRNAGVGEVPEETTTTTVTTTSTPPTTAPAPAPAAVVASPRFTG